MLRSVVAAVACLAAAAHVGAAPQPVSDPAVLLDVPFIPQSEALCGGAAAAMVMRFWGASGVYAESFEGLIDRASGGIRGDDLLRAMRDRGWDAQSFSGDPALLKQQLSKRRPVIALIEDRPGRFHYVVIVSWPDSRIVLHDPARAPFRIVSEETFVRAWDRAGRWAMLVLPSGDLASAVPGPLAPRLSVPLAPRPSGPCDAMVEEGVRLAAADEEGAARLFELAAVTCPRSSAPWRELAGLHALKGRWREASAAADRAVALDPTDQHAWRIVATARYVGGDSIGALEAWNRIGEPRVDLVDIDGLERARFDVIARALDIAPQSMLGADAMRRAERRIRELPAVRSARVAYRPGENGLARVDVAVIERPLLPTSPMAAAALGVRAISDREVRLAVAGLTGGAEVWYASWRWWEHRPRLAAGFSAPAPFGGTWGIEVFDERQAFGSGVLVEERRRGAAFTAADWLTARTRVQAIVGADRWHAGRAMRMGAGVAHHVLRDRLVATLDTEKWFGANDPWTLRARLDVQSSPANEGGVVLANAGASLTSSRAPLMLWHGAGTGPGSDALLRAHPLLDDGIVDRAAFGRRLVHGGVEWRQWMRLKNRPVRFAPAVFADVARAARGAAFSDGRAHVDVGAGLRLPIPGSGIVRIDVARGLRDGKTAVSIGWVR